MDECAVKACPLLRDYHPVFSPELLDVLHLPTLSGMQRLRDIQSYLRNRSQHCRFSKKTIISINMTDKECFAVRYTHKSAELQKLRERIENDSNNSREATEREWAKDCK